MNLVYKPIDKGNFEAVVKLSDALTDNQKRCVASNAYSIAEASVHPDNAYARAIYLGDTPIGFFMVFIPDEKSTAEGDDAFFLWRFMIVPDYQRKGYGRLVLDHVAKLAKAHGFKRVLTSCGMVEDGPYPFYVRYGFKENGDKIGDETVLEYDIDSPSRKPSQEKTPT